MLAQMRPSELGQWVALMRVEPWGAARDDLRSGYVAASLAPAWFKKPAGGSFSPNDFMTQFDYGPQEVADPVAMSRKLRAALGG